MFTSLAARYSSFLKVVNHDRVKKIFGLVVMIAPLITIALLLLINLNKPWDFDESYNLQIVQNLRAGNGYATNGAFIGTGPYLFDPYISTGPSVLLPIWIMSTIVRNTLLASRLVMLCYFLFTLVFLYKLSPRSNFGRFSYGLMLMAISSIVVATNPLYVLGEPPAITFLLLATVAMKYGKTSLIGVALAAVVMCKLNFLLAALAFLFFAFAKLALDNQIGTKDFVRKSTRLISGFVAPILLFEIYRFFSLGGLTAYRTNIRELRNFIDSQRLDHWSSATQLLGSKLTSIINIPGSMVWTAITFCVLGFSLTIACNQNSQVSQRPVKQAALVPPLISGFIILTTFLFLSAAPFARQAVSALYLLFPLIVLVALDRIKILLSEPSRRTRLIGFLAVLMIAVPLGLQTKTVFENSLREVQSPDFGIALEDQRRAANLVRNSGASSMMLDGWFQNPEIQLLSGVPAASMPDSRQKIVMVVSALKYSFTGTYDDFLNQKDLCNEVLYSSESLLVCWPKNR